MERATSNYQTAYAEGALICLGKLVSRYILIPEYFDCNLSIIQGIMDIDSLHGCKNQQILHRRKIHEGLLKRRTSTPGSLSLTFKSLKNGRSTLGKASLRFALFFYSSQDFPATTEDKILGTWTLVWTCITLSPSIWYEVWQCWSNDKCYYKHPT